MDIGILTFWETADNYGQVLQGYAMLSYLRKIGHNPYIIRFDHDNKYNPSIKTKKNGIAKKTVKILLIYPVIQYFIKRKDRINFRKRLIYNQQQNEKRKIDDFRNRYFSFSPNLYLSLDELQKNPPYADVYIAGSDQIWGWSLKKRNNRAFFLDFGEKKIKRISYAPSFAMEIYPHDDIPTLTELLNQFDYISVREKTGLAICKSVGIDAEWVCDPTMLLEGKEYESLIHKYPANNTIYIYSINVITPEEIYWDSVKKVAKRNSLDIKVTTSSGYIPANELFEGVVYEYSKVEEWISNIYNSNFIVTTSFHGIVFCILLNKNFAFVPLKGKFSKGNNRVLDLLELLGLESHIAGDNEIEKIYEKKIDWDEINVRVNQFREKSQEFLMNSLLYND